MKKSLNALGIDHLFGRFSWLNNNDEVDRFINSFGLSAWGEDRPSTGETIVYLLSGDRKHVLQLVPDQERKNMQTFFTKLSLTPDEVRSVYVARLWEKKTNLLRDVVLIPSRTVDLQDFVWVMPQIDRSTKMVNRFFLSKDGEALEGEEMTSFVYTQPGKLPAGHDQELFTAAAGNTLWPGDTMATNDLHHPGDYWIGKEANDVARGRTSIYDKADAIRRHFADGGAGRMKYCSDTMPIHQQLEEFIHSDRVINNIGRVGICDEFAVMQMSFLRALGIPCRIVYLWWLSASKYTSAIKKSNSNPTKEVGHAVVEYLDNNRWVHLDGLWNLHDQPGHYKSVSQSPYVEARWQGFPDDRVSGWDTDHFKDPEADEILNVLNDWKIITNTVKNSIYG